MHPFVLTLGTTPALQRTMRFTSLTINDVNRAAAVHEFASGKNINVARVIRTLGTSVVASGFLGGHNGIACRKELDVSGIRHDFLDVTSNTRTCITLIDQEAHTATELIEEAAAVETSDVTQLLEKLDGLVQHAKLLVLSGTLAPGCRDDFYARCVRLANLAGARAVLDAKGAPLALALAEKPFLVKPNRAELAATVDHPTDSEDQLRSAIRQITERGAGWAVVTNGPGETIASNGQQFWKIQSPVVQAVNPIGSGDSVAAGIAVGLQTGMDVPQSCALGIACGAANAMTEYAGHVRCEDVESLRARVEITEIS